MSASGSSGGEAHRVGIVLSEHTAEDRATIFLAGLPDGPRRHRVEAALRALPVGPVAGLAQAGGFIVRDANGQALAYVYSGNR